MTSNVIYNEPQFPTITTNMIVHVGNTTYGTKLYQVHHGMQ